MVFARGEVPCDVLFIGEAPGRSENVDPQARAFIGPAGKLQDSIVKEVLESLDPQVKVRILYSNLCCCLPLGENKEIRRPEPEEIKACSPRLTEFVNEVAKPRLIVSVGELARTWLPKILNSAQYKFVTQEHPSSILRQGFAMRSGLIQRTVVILRGAIEDAMRTPAKRLEIVPQERSNAYDGDDIPF